MMPVIAIATMLSAPAVDLCGMKAGQFQVGIVIAPSRAGAAPAPVPASVAVRKAVVAAPNAGGSTMVVRYQ